MYRRFVHTERLSRREHRFGDFTTFVPLLFSFVSPEQKDRKNRKIRMKFHIFLLCSILNVCFAKYSEPDPFGTKSSYFAVGNSDER